MATVHYGRLHASLGSGAKACSASSAKKPSHQGVHDAPGGAEHPLWRRPLRLVLHRAAPRQVRRGASPRWKRSCAHVRRRARPQGRRPTRAASLRRLQDPPALASWASVGANCPRRCSAAVQRVPPGLELRRRLADRFRCYGADRPGHAKQPRIVASNVFNTEERQSLTRRWYLHRTTHWCQLRVRQGSRC